MPERSSCAPSPSSCGWRRSVRAKGEAARARLSGIKSAGADNPVLVVEYLSALERIGDGRATKLVIPAEFSSLLGTVAALTETTRADDDSDEVRPKLGLPIPATTERVDAPPPDGVVPDEARRRSARGLVPRPGGRCPPAVVGGHGLDRRLPRPSQPG